LIQHALLRPPERQVPQRRREQVSNANSA
jgi:hypothetical protein